MPRGWVRRSGCDSLACIGVTRVKNPQGAVLMQGLMDGEQTQEGCGMAWVDGWH